MLTLLKYPYPRDVEEPECYETVRVHAEWGNRSNDKEDVNNSKGPVSVSRNLNKVIFSHSIYIVFNFVSDLIKIIFANRLNHMLLSN